MTRWQALSLVDNERNHQERLCASGRFRYTCASTSVGLEAKLAILGKEYGELCRAVLHASGIVTIDRDAHLQAELLHVAAVAVAWLEAFDFDGEDED